MIIKGTKQLGKISRRSIAVNKTLPGGRKRSTPLVIQPIPSSGLELWLKADEGVITNGSEVTAWNDQSNNNNNAAGNVGVGTNPVLVTNSLNGKPGIQFNGNQILLTNNFYPVNYNTPITMIGVAKASASSVKGDQYTARWFETASSQNRFDTGLVFGPYNGTPAFGTTIGISHQGESNILNSNMGEDEVGLAIMINNGTDSKYYHNGVYKGSYAFGWNSGSTTDGGFAIGATYVPNLNLIGFKSTSTIYELIIYNRAISTQERQQVETYLNEKYNIIPAIPTNELSLWLKADKGVTYDGSNNVSAWEDQSTNENDASASIGQQPVYVANSLNGKPILRFNGTGKKMSLTNNIGGTEYTFFIVAKNNDNINGSMFLWTTDNSYGRYIGVIAAPSYNASARNKFVLSENDIGSGMGTLAWSSKLVNNNFFIGTAIQNGGGKAYANGSGSGSVNSIGSFSANNTFNLIGGYEFGYELDGDVAEIIAYNRVLSFEERQQIEAYLNQKYNIIPAIPAIPPNELSLWLKADEGVVTVEDSGSGDSGSSGAGVGVELLSTAVVAWNDQSGNNRNFTKSVANSGFPTLVDGAVRFTSNATYGDRNASILALPSNSLNFTTPYTLIAVVRAGPENSCVFSKSTDNNKRRKYQISVNGGNIYSLEGSGDIYFSYNTGTGNNVNIKRLIIAQYSSTNFGIMRYNGAQVASSNNNNTINQTNNAPILIGASPFQVGSGYNAEASRDMYVYEIIFYNRALSEQEMVQIETYLNTKYSIY